jgi:glycogen/starch/alpha-glucan phosphorylase-like protein
VNHLRLWSGSALQPFHIEDFNAGNYSVAVEDQVDAKNLSRVLYPDDSTPQGKELRFKQQYFFVSASIQDILATHLSEERTLEELPTALAIQMNDTHPTLAIPELMRLLVDQYDMPWAAAWEICRNVFGYTNHTLLPEALETWPVQFFEHLLPRHLEIIYRINEEFLLEVEKRFKGDGAAKTTLSIIGESYGRRVRMSHLAVVQPQGERCGEAAFRTHAEDHLLRVRADVSRPLHQRHQWHHGAPLAQAIQSAAVAPADRTARIRLGERPGGNRAPAPGGGRCGVSRVVPRNQAG